MKNITNNTMYTAQELHIFHNHLEVNYKSFQLNVIFSHQYLQYILQLIYQLTINILHHHMIFLILIHKYLDSK